MLTVKTIMGMSKPVPAQPAQHKTQGKRKADRWKGVRSEMKEGKSKNSSLSAFSQIFSLLLVVNNSNLTLFIFVDLSARSSLCAILLPRTRKETDHL